MTVCDGKDVYLLNTRFGLITLPSPAINKFLDKSLIYKTYDESVSKNDIDVKIVLAIWHNKQNNQAQPWWRHVWILFDNIKKDSHEIREKNFFNCYLATPRQTLGHYREESLTHAMLITAFTLFLL